MTTTHWLVQTNVFPPSPTPLQLARACAEAGRPFLAIDHPPGRIQPPEVPAVARAGPVVFHGRSSLILGALHSPWRDGVFFDPDTFGHAAYARGYGDLLLNADAEVLPWTAVLARARHDTRHVFLKPVDDFKGFTGQVVPAGGIEAFFHELTRKGGVVTREALVVVGPAHEIDAEWRLFVVDGAVVTGSQYRPTGGGVVPDEVVAFGARAVRVWSPAAVFALDVARVGARLAIVECNCFNASRFYDADAARLVRAVSEYQEALKPAWLVSPKGW